jgi:hypothetical protein
VAVASRLDDQKAVIYDAVIMRTIVDLPEDQVKALAAFCELQGISRAEAVRRAVARLLAEERRPGRERAFGAWRTKRVDAATMIRGLRDEWQP